MSLALLHRRLVVGMGLVALAAFAGGAGFEPISAALAGLALTLAFFWQPDSSVSETLERFWLPLAGVLVLRALYHFFLIGDDVVIPVVDLLLLLLCAEALRSLDVPNDSRLYYLTFALMLAAAAYRPGVVFALSFVTPTRSMRQRRRVEYSRRDSPAPIAPCRIPSTPPLSG